MYKGYKIVADERFYTIYDERGMVRGKGTISRLKSSDEKNIIEDLIRHLGPKKPDRRLETEIKEDRLKIKLLCFCPDCGWKLGKADDEYKYHHCALCGQVLDWS